MCLDLGVLCAIACFFTGLVCACIWVRRYFSFLGYVWLLGLWCLRLFVISLICVVLGLILLLEVLVSVGGLLVIWFVYC